MGGAGLGTTLAPILGGSVDGAAAWLRVILLLGQTNSVSRVLPITPALSEGGITASADSVWLVSLPVGVCFGRSIRVTVPSARSI